MFGGKLIIMQSVINISHRNKQRKYLQESHPNLTPNQSINNKINQFTYIYQLTFPSKQMLKVLILLLSAIALCTSFTIFGHTFLQSEPNDELFHLGDEINKGTSITQDIQNKIKSVVEQAYIFNGNSTIKNILFIQQQLAITYGGNWVVSIFGGYGNGTDTLWGKNLGISSYSTGGQWWIYWKGANHYQTNQSYYIAKQQGNTTIYTCLTNANYTYTSDVFKNVVNAAEIDYRDMQNFTAQIQSYLHGFSLDIYPTVVAVNASLPFFTCAWGNNTYNAIQKTDKLGLIVMSTPRVG